LTTFYLLVFRFSKDNATNNGTKKLSRLKNLFIDTITSRREEKRREEKRREEKRREENFFRFPRFRFFS